MVCSYVSVMLETTKKIDRQEVVDHEIALALCCPLGGALLPTLWLLMDVPLKAIRSASLLLVTAISTVRVQFFFTNPYSL